MVEMWSIILVLFGVKRALGEDLYQLPLVGI